MRHTKHGVAWIECGLSILLGLAVAGLPAGQAGAQELSKSAGSQDALHGVQLAGTVEGANQQLTGAVFEDPQTKKQTAYRVGDLVDGATIVEIKRQQVVLQRGDARMVVHITGGSPVVNQAVEEPNKRTAGDVIPVPAGDPQLARQFVISKVIPPYDPRIEKARTAISRTDINRFAGYFQEQLKEAAAVLVTTRQVGAAVDLAAVDTELLRSLNLEPTDLIVGINGMGVDSTDRFGQILDILGGNHVRVFNIVVLRDNAIHPLYYTVQ